MSHDLECGYLVTDNLLPYVQTSSVTASPLPVTFGSNTKGAKPRVQTIVKKTADVTITISTFVQGTAETCQHSF